MSLVEEAPKGRLQGLVALRDRLALELDSAANPAAVAALSRQFADVLLQIDELDVSSAGDGPVATPLDGLMKKIAERRAKTS